MEDSADAEESIGGDAEEEKSGVIEFEPIEASILSASDGGGGGDSDGNVVVEDDIESMSPLTGVPPAGPGDDAPSVVSAAMGGSIVGAPPLLTGSMVLGSEWSVDLAGRANIIRVKLSKSMVMAPTRYTTTTVIERSALVRSAFAL